MKLFVLLTRGFEQLLAALWGCRGLFVYPISMVCLLSPPDTPGEKPEPSAVPAERRERCTHRPQLGPRAEAGRAQKGPGEMGLRCPSLPLLSREREGSEAVPRWGF